MLMFQAPVTTNQEIMVNQPILLSSCLLKLFTLRFNDKSLNFNVNLKLKYILSPIFLMHSCRGTGFRVGS